MIPGHSRRQDSKRFTPRTTPRICAVVMVDVIDQSPQGGLADPCGGDADDIMVAFPGPRRQIEVERLARRVSGPDYMGTVGGNQLVKTHTIQLSNNSETSMQEEKKNEEKTSARDPSTKPWSARSHCRVTCRQVPLYLAIGCYTEFREHKKNTSFIKR